MDLKKSCIWCNQKVLSILKVLTNCASSNDPSMDWCKHLGVGIYALISWSKHIVLIQTCGEACIYKKVSGSSVAFLILYVDNISLIGNDMEILDSMKGYLNESFSKQDLGEVAYTLSIKIYIDRSRRLISFFFNEYIPW